jgi:N6-adenosine-specific RNA methylase IME4
MTLKSVSPAVRSGEARQEPEKRPVHTAIPATAQATRPINEIRIGERHRRDLGDIEGLAASIDDIGLLQPIAVLADGRLVGGARRLAAAMALGWTEIPVHVVDIDQVIRGEFAENVHRKDFTPSELVAIGQEVERIERERAKTRMVAAHASPGKLPELEKGDARDKIAAHLGISGRTYEKAKAVVEAANAEPDRFGHLIPELDRYRGVDRAYRALHCARDEARVLNLRPREGKFRTLVIDIPWEFDVDLLGRGQPQYALMDREQALALPIPAWAENNCHLYLWTTNALAPFAHTLLPHFGFEYKTTLTWAKPRYGLGAWFRGQTEHVLFGVRGELGTRSNSISTLFEAPRGEHSEKPEQFYDIVRAASYPPFGEAFQRKARPDFVNLYEPSDEAPPQVDTADAEVVS